MEIEDILRKGLCNKPKYIPAWYRYDKAGSILNDDCIEESPFYYFHKSEKTLLKDVVEELTGTIHFPSALMDLGSGNSMKTRMIIDGILKQQDVLKYIPVDISTEFLQETCDTLSEEYNGHLNVHPCPGDYSKGIKMLGELETNVLLMFLGSLQNCTRQEQLNLLASVRQNMKDSDFFLLSADITSDKETILNAYLYPGDFTERFNLNIIKRLNREMKGNIDLQNFSIERELYQSSEKDETSSLQIFLKAKEHGVYRLDTLDMNIAFEKGERLNLYEGEGTSHKYTIEQLRYLTKKAHLNIHRMWTNEHVALILLCKERFEI